MVICIDIETVNTDPFLGCFTYQIMEQTDSTHLRQQAYYAIQAGETTLYVRRWDLIRL